MKKASYLAIGKMKMVEREENGKTQDEMQSEKAASLYQVPVTPEIGELYQVPAPCKSVPHSPVQVALQWLYSGSRVRYGGSGAGPLGCRGCCGCCASGASSALCRVRVARGPVKHALTNPPN